MPILAMSVAAFFTLNLAIIKAYAISEGIGRGRPLCGRPKTKIII
jgi:hypothetical protein